MAQLLDKEEKLALFFLELEDDLEAFEEDTAGEYKLNYSIESLHELERYIIEQEVNFVDPSDAALVQRSKCWEYLGELVRKNFAGKWKISDNEDNTANRGLYVIEGHSSVPGVEFEPLRLIKGFTKHHRPGTFRRAIEADINPQPFDFGDLQVEDSA